LKPTVRVVVPELVAILTVIVCAPAVTEPVFQAWPSCCLPCP